MIDSKEFLPLGSVVLLEHLVNKKLMIVSRHILFNDKLYDYGGSLYPEGMIDGTIAYFMATDIKAIIYSGFTDDEDVSYIASIRAENAETIGDTVKSQTKSLFSGLHDDWED